MVTDRTSRSGLQLKVSLQSQYIPVRHTCSSILDCLSMSLLQRSAVCNTCCMMQHLAAGCSGLQSDLQLSRAVHLMTLVHKSSTSC